ncbi:hypothetical protein CEXT_455181 [Caerostris extrusa]|uniref:Uncharacterized protein n=1 Tax=Caerostris extrusa TaxID=172846 RepID=A0AAV4QCH5_CAEEX|nr:hypothetical protein CEXT_455181 [Caerostris extrusa]
MKRFVVERQTRVGEPSIKVIAGTSVGAHATSHLMETSRILVVEDYIPTPGRFWRANINLIVIELRDTTGKIVEEPMIEELLGCWYCP